MRLGQAAGTVNDNVELEQKRSSVSEDEERTATPFKSPDPCRGIRRLLLERSWSDGDDKVSIDILWGMA